MASNIGKVTIDLHKTGQPECCAKLRNAGWKFGYSHECQFVWAEHPLGGKQSIVEVLRVGRTGFDADQIGQAIALLLNGGETNDTPPRAPRGERHGGKGRAITATEFAGMLRAVRGVVHPQPPRPWRRLLRGLWLSGLRLGEALRLTWDAGPLRLDLDHDFPVIRIAAGADKRGRASLLPITPDFARWVARVPRDRRTGWVFPLPHSRRPSSERITRAISAIGAASHRGPGKHPTAHDLRRSFATRWAFRLPPLALQAILRHSSMHTTLGYYVDLSSTAADVAKLLAGQ